MGYVCVDRGSLRCPCHLMAAGQCYTCTMTRTGRCSCEDAAGWQGVCPYTEYIRRGETAVSREPDILWETDVLEKIHYGNGLFVIRLAVSAGLAEACRRPGAYLMAEALGCRTPVSVLRTRRQGGNGFRDGCRDGFRDGCVELAVKAAGPKSEELTKKSVWRIAGPYYGGLLRDETLTAEGKLLVIARGVAAAPFLALRQLPEYASMDAEVYLDDETLPEAFLEEYLCGQVFETIRLNQEGYLERMKRILQQHICVGCGEETPRSQGAMVLVSPYFIGKLTEDLTAEEKERLVVPNPANLCCGMGLCGSCSHTDPDGLTVRLCKCSPAVIE
ncbi:MAG: hypothetical protein ACI4WY_10485 [Anaerovoracaceae bacterium]